MKMIPAVAKVNRTKSFLNDRTDLLTIGSGVLQCERSSFPDSLRSGVVGWMEKGLSQADAARHLNVSRSVVHCLWNQYQTEASVSRRHVPGQP
ncbi:paired domain-containing protein [Trichonephila clavipes]|nr:paired domain-containing protein [Trichonephila clavipes]